jgi:hypothetical protein
LRSIEKSNRRNKVIGDHYPKVDGLIEGYRALARQIKLHLGDWFLGHWRKLSFATSLNVGYAFDCVVVKEALGISDAPFDLKEIWGDIYVMGMENVMVEMFVRGDVIRCFWHHFFC